MYVIGGLELGVRAVPLSSLIRQLRVSKQVASWSTRGWPAATWSGLQMLRITPGLPRPLRNMAKPPRECRAAARAKVDAALMAKVRAADLQRTRRTHARLIEIGTAWTGPGDD